MHEAFARLAAESLAAQTRAPIQIRLTSVQPQTYDEFRASSAAPAALAGVVLEPLAGVTLLILDRHAAFSLIDRLLGGHGVPGVPARDLSEIEQSVLENCITGVIAALRPAWQPVMSVRPRLEYLERGSHSAALISPAAMLVRVAFATRIGGVEGSLELGIPFPTLRPVWSRFAAGRSLAKSGAPATERPATALRDALGDVPVTVTAELGSATVPLPSVLALEAGDLIRLGDCGRPPHELDLRVGGKLKFRCRPGVVGNRLAVQVVKPAGGAAEVAAS